MICYDVKETYDFVRNTIIIHLIEFSGHVARALSACVIYGVKIAGIKETLSKI